MAHERDMSRFHARFTADKPLIGMIHLPPLPGYADSPGIQKIVKQAITDAEVLAGCGFDGVLIENEYDRPHTVKATRETVAAMIEVTAAVVTAKPDLVVGCEVLLHDPVASLNIARASGADFIRTDYFVDRMTRPEFGEFEIDPDGLIALRAALGAQNVLILADIQVKYATMIEPRPLAESAILACDKGADAVIVTGRASGDAPMTEHLREAKLAICNTGIPVLTGSGMKQENAASVMSECDGAIVGTSLMTRTKLDQYKALALTRQLGRLPG